jgi:hypothetical protein
MEDQTFSSPKLSKDYAERHGKNPSLSGIPLGYSNIRLEEIA